MLFGHTCRRSLDVLSRRVAVMAEARGLSPGLLASQGLSSVRPAGARAGPAIGVPGRAGSAPLATAPSPLLSADGRGVRTAATSSCTAGRVSAAQEDSVVMASTHVAVLIDSPAATINRTKAATPTAARDW